jgi:hypothetical protein
MEIKVPSPTAKEEVCVLQHILLKIMIVKVHMLGVNIMSSVCVNMMDVNIMSTICVHIVDVNMTSTVFVHISAPMFYFFIELRRQ